MSNLVEKPEWIPCITARVTLNNLKDFEQNSKHLISVSPKVPFVKARDLTIVDCRTYGLWKNRSIDPVKHYFWFMDFAKDIYQEEDVVFIPPDADWLGKDTDRQLADRWLDLIGDRVKCLVVPHTALFNLIINPVGYAVRANQGLITHPEWTHCFTRYYDRAPRETKLWTYDSICE